MVSRVRLDEVLTPHLLETRAEHIRGFLLMEGITPDAHELGRTQLTERQIKELLAELAEET
jgi:hypothetical protein